MSSEQSKLPPRTFTSEDADRLLGFADLYLEDWQLVPEWKAIRPLLVAAPELLEALDELMDTWQANPDHYQEEIEKYGPLIAKAKGGGA